MQNGKVIWTEISRAEHEASPAGLHHDHVAAEAISGHTHELPEGFTRVLVSLERF